MNIDNVDDNKINCLTNFIQIHGKEGKMVVEKSFISLYTLTATAV
jgi:hypothetical protein